MARNRKLGFSAVTTEGDILSATLLQRIHQEDPKLGGLGAADFNLSGYRVRERISRSWERLRGAWESFQTGRQTLTESETGTPLARKFLAQVLDELGYGRVQAARPVVVGEDEYAISHRHHNVPFHLVGCNLDLDRRNRAAQDAALIAPHALVQRLLNASDDHLWGFVSNGLRFRVLRDSSNFSRNALVEFDLEALFEGQLYDEFRLFWLVCHESRVVHDVPKECWLERWRQVAQEDGRRVLTELRSGVEEAIATLGQGFLSDTRNERLRTALRNGDVDKQEYYRQLLRMVYQLLFLLAAEERDLLHPPDTDAETRERYSTAYSLQRLRLLVERQSGSARHHDWFEQFRVVVRLLSGKETYAPLGLPALGGFLFSPTTYPLLDGAKIHNRAFGTALKKLTVTEEGGKRVRIDYRNMGSEELGSVYESLLELHPEITVGENGYQFKLDRAGGNDRKTTGSYYTPDSLIQCLLDSSLEPVIEDRLKRAGREKAAREAALLSLSVVDTAVGSGHFLIAAAHRIARSLAQVRSGEEEPTPAVVRTAVRDVIGNCLYGIDLNPMSAELCKVALWMESLEPGKPLGFLEHHIQVGNSLMGATPELIAGLIPDTAYAPIAGDDKSTCTALKAQNKSERSGQLALGSQVTLPLAEVRRLWNDLGAIADDSLDAVARKEAAFATLTEASRSARLIADTWCAAFTCPKAPGLPAITTATLQRIADDPDGPEAQLVQDQAARFRFLHPHIAFPGVFARGGFDLVIGNPPWERVKLQEKEFFAERSTSIANAPNKAERDRLIRALEGTALHREFLDAKRGAEATSAFLRTSGRFPLAGRGDVNLFAVFAELNRTLIGPTGRAGVIVPTGIATDDSTKFLFADLIERKALASLYDFENGMRAEDDAEESEEELPAPKRKRAASSENRRLFAEVHASFKFCLITMAGEAARQETPRFAFFCHRPSDIERPGKAFVLTPEDIALLNPNTRTCPVFRSERDAEITKEIYRRVPVLIREARDGEPEQNPWGITFQRMFDMSTDSHLFRTREQLEAAGGVLDGNHFLVEHGTGNISAGRWLPLYEAKMMQQFDHRAADVVKSETAVTRQNQPRAVHPTEKANVQRLAVPIYWVSAHNTNNALSQFSDKGWLSSWRDITSPTNERTLLSAIVPRAGCGDTVLLMSSRLPSHIESLIIADLNSFVVDFVTRQKIGGIHLKFHYFKQICHLPPGAYIERLVWSDQERVATYVWPRVLELTYTAHDLDPFARDLGYAGPPFVWDEERRFQLRAELDAAFFHLYGISRADVEYIMETFPIVKRKDIAACGSFRTKDAILREYDRMAECARTGESYVSPLDPPPAHGWVPPEMPAWTDWEGGKAGSPASPSGRKSDKAAPVEPGGGSGGDESVPMANLFEPAHPTLFEGSGLGTPSALALDDLLSSFPDGAFRVRVDGTERSYARVSATDVKVGDALIVVEHAREDRRRRIVFGTLKKRIGGRLSSGPEAGTLVQRFYLQTASELQPIDVVRGEQETAYLAKRIVD